MPNETPPLKPLEELTPDELHLWIDSLVPGTTFVLNYHRMDFMVVFGEHAGFDISAWGEKLYCSESRGWQPIPDWLKKFQSLLPADNLKVTRQQLLTVFELLMSKESTRRKLLALRRAQ